MCTGIEVFLAAHAGKIALAGLAVATTGAVSAGIAEKKRANLDAAIREQEGARAVEVAAASEDAFRRDQSRVFGARRFSAAPAVSRKRACPIFLLSMRCANTY